MKKVNIIGKMTLAALALWAVISCETPDSPGAQTPPLTITADGSDSAATTALALSLNPGIPGLTVEDITIDPEDAFTKGTLTMDSADGTSYTLAVSAVLNTRNVTVTVAKEGQAARSATVKVYSGAEGLDVTLTATANGAQGSTATTALTLNFNPGITGLTAENITLSSGITKGTLTGDGAAGTSYTLAVSGITSIAQITVTVNKAGYNVQPAVVTVYAGTGGESLTEVTLGISANGTQGTTATTALTLSFNPGITGLTAADITLSGGITKGALSGSGTSYTLAVTVINTASITVTVSKAGYAVNNNPATVNVFGLPPPPNVTSKTGHAAGPATGVIELTMEGKPAAGTVIAWGTSNDRTQATGAYTVTGSEFGEDGPFVLSVPQAGGLTLGATYYAWINSVNLGAIPVHFTEADLAKIGVDEAFPLDGEYTLTRNLDLSVLEYEEEIGGWTPIGVSAEAPFSGKFDGKNFTISNLALAQYDTVHIGLFGYVKGTSETSAEIKNLTVKLDGGHTDLDLTLADAVQYVGVVSGRADYTDFENITVQGSGISIEKDTNTAFGFSFGGISGGATNTSAITNCHVELDIDARVSTGTGNLTIGGLAAGDTSSPAITGSIYKGDISCETGGSVFVGGLRGNATSASGTHGAINNSHITGSITVTEGSTVAIGGVVSYGAASNSSFNGNITSQNAASVFYVGGIAGNVPPNSVIDSCRATSGPDGGIFVTGSGNSGIAIQTATPFVGGIAGGGGTTVTISNCYSSMANIIVTATGYSQYDTAAQTNLSVKVGGIAGNTAKVENSYSAVPVISATANGNVQLGGISGATTDANAKKNVVLTGRFTGTSPNEGQDSYPNSSSNDIPYAVVVRRVTAGASPSDETNIASDVVVLINETTQLYPEGSQELDIRKDGNTKTAAELQVENLFFGVESGQLSWDKSKWKWDSSAQRPKLAWE